MLSEGLTAESNRSAWKCTSPGGAKPAGSLTYIRTRKAALYDGKAALYDGLRCSRWQAEPLLNTEL